MNVPQDKRIVMFDGVCNLCNSSVNYIIDRDHDDLYRFVALQSELGKELQQYLGISETNLDSIILYIPNEAYYIKSSAALKIMQSFKGVWKLSYIFNVLPTTFRDKIYDYVAKNRYKWYGKKEQCRIPTPELRSKFL